MNGMMPNINSWYLTKIELPEGGEISFTYTTISNLNYDIFGGMNFFSSTGYASNPYPLIAKVFWSNIKTDIKHLSQINFSGGRIRLIPHSEDRADFKRDKALQKIILEKKTSTTQYEVLKQYLLSYKILEGVNLISYEGQTTTGQHNTVEYLSSIPTPLKRRLILTNIMETDASGVAANTGYSFDYIRTKALPHRFYPHVDFWGYANEVQMIGNPYDRSFVERVSQSEYRLIGKEPDLEMSKQGTLYKITHPTRGTTTFEYELHDYSFTIAPQHFYRESNNQTIGGLRVKTNTNYDPVTGRSIIKKYNYNASGVMVGMPAFNRVYRESHPPAFQETIYNIISNVSCYPIPSSNSSYAVYGLVTEELINESDSSSLCKSEYKYTTPDLIYRPPGYTNTNFYEFPYPPHADIDWCKGVLRERIDFIYENNRYEEVKRLTNNWDISVNLLLEGYKVGVEEVAFRYGGVVGIEVYYPVYGGSIKLKFSEEKEKRGNVWISTRNDYEYGGSVSRPLLNTTTTSDGRTLYKYALYPYDYADASGFVKQLKDKNMLSRCIEEVSAIKEGSTLKITSGKICEYNSDGTPSKIKQLETTVPILQNQFKFSSKAKGSLPGSGTKSNYSVDSQYKDKVTFSYNNGRTSSITTDQITTSYLWGYNYQYPIAEIRNATYDQVKAVLNETVVSRLAGNPVPSEADLTALKNLRTSTNANLKKAFVTVYEYKPLVGISKQTDPRGIVTLYDYDAFGRLTKVTYDGKIIEEYNYNYRNQ